MKKRLTLLMSALLCVSALVLPACGGSSGSAGGGSAAEEKVDPSAKFIGTWKFAAAQVKGITMTGNIGMFIDGADDGIILNISEDGKASLSLGEDSADATWELTDDETITMTVQQKSDDESTTDIIDESQPVPIKFVDGALSLEMKTDDMAGAMIFTQDGTWDGATMISAASLTEITDSKVLVGEWKLTGVTMQGICMYGSAEDLSSVVPTDTDTTITINEDGTAKAMGQDMTWSVDDSGAKLSAGGSDLPLKAFDGGIALDMSDFFGTELVMLYSK